MERALADSAGWGWRVGWRAGGLAGWRVVRLLPASCCFRVLGDVLMDTLNLAWRSGGGARPACLWRCGCSSPSRTCTPSLIIIKTLPYQYHYHQYHPIHIITEPVSTGPGTLCKLKEDPDDCQSWLRYVAYNISYEDCVPV